MNSTPSNKPIRHDLSRFHEAQEGRGEGSSFATALEEIRNGRKSSHWMWYVFPQLPLGTSFMSRKYAIADAGEARAYLSDNILRDRLLLITNEVSNHLEVGIHPTVLMGSTIDCAKLSSSMTLFGNSTIAFQDIEIHVSCGRAMDLLARTGFSQCDQTSVLLEDFDK